ncbi:MAG: hypothetical protein IH819_03485, partial [Bacteroidetes bacterium]|nr:hypothetical protein [Bacteroidota bacterium]
IKPFTSFSGGPSRFVFGPFADNASTGILLTDDERIGFNIKYSVSQGRWNSNASTITLNAWNHIMITKDSTTPTEDPVIFINGSSVTVNEILTPSGSINSEIGANWVIGNYKTATQDFPATFDGQIFDCRLYHEIKLVADAVTLYNSGSPDASLLTSGLKFQAMVVKSEDASGHIGAAFTETEKVFPVK